MDGIPDDEDSEPVMLSDSTLAILKQFLTEREVGEKEAENDPFSENWGMSQFWYTDETAERLADEVVRRADGGKIACLACPSLYRKLREKHPSAQAWLFEYDQRFAVLGNFQFWDYNSADDLPASIKHSFQVVSVDPPYLSAECLTKSLNAMELLAEVDGNAALFALTGASMSGTAKSQLGLRPVKWRPEHKSKLGNDFCFYTRDAATAQRFEGWDGDFE